jgi:hypothetical protein
MGEKEKQFLSEIASDNPELRFAAWRRAGEMNPDVIPELAKLAAAGDAGVTKAAREAIATITHSVGKKNSDGRRPAVVKQLLSVASSTSPVPVRAHVLRLLSLVADERAVPAIARWIHHPELAEEVVFCLERIPGTAANKALVDAYAKAGADLKARILAALGHRRAAQAVPLSMEAMRAADTKLAIAGVKAFGRTGRKPRQTPRFPAEAQLSEWQKIERMDSLLRYADAQAAQGNKAEAAAYYRAALDHAEEHWQCAGIVGIAKLGDPDAAAAISPKLKSPSHKVRIAAEKALNRAGRE